MEEKSRSEELCLRCGVCCNPIHLRFEITDDLLVANAPDGWLQKHLRLIRIAYNGKYFLYDCDFFDHRTKLCQAQSWKPDFCRSYPLYLDVDEFNYDTALNIGCGYRKLWEDEMLQRQAQESNA